MTVYVAAAPRLQVWLDVWTLFIRAISGQPILRFTHVETERVLGANTPQLIEPRIQRLALNARRLIQILGSGFSLALAGYMNASGKWLCLDDDSPALVLILS